MTEYRGERHTLRQACIYCGSIQGRIATKNGQDMVSCVCGRWQYNAPKTETGRRPRTATAIHDMIKPSQRARILMRATGRCELCGSRENLHVGHLLSAEAVLLLGMTEAQLNDDENLCAMCEACNLGVGKEPVPARWLMALVLTRIAADRQSNHEPATVPPAGDQADEFLRMADNQEAPP